MTSRRQPWTTWTIALAVALLAHAVLGLVHVGTDHSPRPAQLEIELSLSRAPHASLPRPLPQRRETRSHEPAPHKPDQPVERPRPTPHKPQVTRRPTPPPRVRTEPRRRTRLQQRTTRRMPTTPPRRPTERRRASAQKHASTHKALTTPTRPRPDPRATRQTPRPTRPSRFNYPGAITPTLALTPLDMRRYLKSAQIRIKRHKRYPFAAKRMGLSGKVIVGVCVSRTGRLATRPQLLKSSGHAILDKEALRMVGAAPPFQRLPNAFRRERYTFQIPIIFAADL